MGTDKRKSYFTSEELATLKTAFDDTCAALGLAPADEIHRAWLGEILFAIAAEKGGSDAAAGARRVRGLARDDVRRAKPAHARAGEARLVQALRRGVQSAR